MFYAASRRVGALIEARVEAGETVYLSQWIGRNRMPVNRILDKEDQELRETESTTIHGPNDDILLTYLDTQFTKRIHSTFADDYKFTAAIAQQLTTKFPPNDEHDIHDDGYVALKYPSVLGLDDCHNTAMHASFAVERLDLLHVMELNVLSVDAADVTVEVQDNAIVFENGNISWSGDTKLVPTILDKNRGVPFIRGAAKWNLKLHDSPITPDYVKSLMAD